MGHNGNSYYIGIDLNDSYAMVSFFQQNMKEPETVSTVAGSEEFQIPLVLARRKSIGKWYYGDEARRLSKSGEMVCIDQLLKRALNSEKIVIDDDSFMAEELLALFLKKVMELPSKLGNPSSFDRLVICVDRLTKENVSMFYGMAVRLGINSRQLTVIDRKESFYYFALNQDNSLWLHDVVMFMQEKESIFFYSLKRDLRTTPQVVSIDESISYTLDKNDKDKSFLDIINESFKNQIISTVFLVGDTFAEGWMKQSVVYMGENEMKFNLSLKVHDKGELSFYNLISAGSNWFESKGQCEVIISGSYEVDFWKQLPKSREAKIETLRLTDMPPRPDRATRIRITATPVSDDRIDIEIKDLGFGEIFMSSGKVWHYEMTM